MNLVRIFILMLISIISSLAYADWSSQFIGQINFRLNDDPEYASKMNELRQIEAKEIETKRKLEEKQRELKEASLQLSNKRNSLEKAQDELEAKTNQIAEAERKIPSLQNENNTLNLNIQNAQSKISGVENVINTATTELSNLQIQNRNLEVEIANLKARVAELQRQCDLQPNPSDAQRMPPCPQVVELKAKLSRMEMRSSELESQISNVQTKIAEAKSDLIELKNIIAHSQSKIEQNNRELVSLQNQIVTLKNQLPEINSRIANLSREVELLKTKEQALVSQVQALDTEVDRMADLVRNERNEFAFYQKKIETQILNYNQMGVSEAKRDGTQDGNEVASRVGNEHGSKNGRADGLASGERAGRDRDYNVGISQGEIAGSKDGLRKGENEGQIYGIKHGNQEAGRRAGHLAGVQRANQSDANAVGEKQGNKEGLETAIKDGKKQGYITGEQEIIEEKESAKLNELEISGQFAATFNGSIPTYPGPSRRNYNSSAPVSRAIFAKSYVAGYEFTYPRSAESAYYAVIQNVYQKAYDVAHSQAHKEAYARDYADSRQDGYDVQYHISYDREYDRAYRRVHDEYFDLYVNKPQVSGDDYKNSYKNAELSAYNSRYEEIRSLAYERIFDLVYNQNIGSQTEKYRQERRGQVELIYANNSALKFVEHNYVDTGINSIGMDDGIYMPQEAVTHHLTIINFGNKAATNVTVTFKDGKSVTIPAIPGLSKTKVKGAARHFLSNAALGNKEAFQLKINGDLNQAENKILGRHFSDKDQGILNLTKEYVVSLSRPLKINHIKTLTAVFYDTEVKLQTFLTNVSTKSIKGKIQFKLTTSFGEKPVLKSFNDLSEIAKDVTLEDAKIKVRGEENLFSTIRFQLSVLANDVVIAQSDFQGAQIVKAPYVERAVSPVIVFNSSDGYSCDDFKELLKIFGGMNQISILDLNGESQNQEILNTKMTGKSLIILLDKSDNVVGRLGELYKQNHLALAFYGGNENTLNSFKIRVSELGDSTLIKMKIEDDLVPVLSTSLLKTEREDKISAITANEDNILDRLSLLSMLKLTDNDLGNELINTFNQEKFLHSDKGLVLRGKVFALRVLEDLSAINKAYVDAETRRVRRVSRRYLKTEDELLINKFSREIHKGDLDNRLPLSFYAIPLQHGLEEIFETNKNLIHRVIEKKAKKIIEDFDKVSKKNLTKLVYVQIIDEILKIEKNYYLQ